MFDNMDWLNAILGGGNNQQNSLNFSGSNYNPSQSSVLTGTTDLAGTNTAGGTGGFNLSGLLNFDNLGSLAQGIGSLGQLYMGNQQLGLARDAFNQSKKAYQQNMANSIASYNTTLEDRIRGRTSNYEGKEQDVQNYLSANKLS